MISPTVRWVVVLATIASVVYGTIPAAQVRLTKTGLDYGVKLAAKNLEKAVTTAKLKPFSGKSKHMSYTLSNLKITEFSIGSAALVPQKNRGVLWKMGGVSIVMTGSYAYRYRVLFVKISDHGSFRLTTSGLSLNLVVKVTANPSTGVPVVHVDSCDCHINRLKLKFTGGKAKWLYNLLVGFVEGKLKKVIQNAVCQQGRIAVDRDGNRALAKLQLNVSIAHKFLLSYSLTENPKFASNYIETYHKGEVFWAGDKHEAPFKPTGFGPFAGVSKMVYLWLSDYVANSFSYAAFSHSYLRYNLSASELPKKSRHYLDTTCTVGSVCIGDIIAQIGKTHPNCTVMIELEPYKAPFSEITPKEITVNGVGSAKFYAISPQKTEDYMLKLNLSLLIKAKVSLKDAVLYGKVDKLSLKFHVVESRIGTIYDVVLETIAKFAIDAYVKPKLNEFGAKGFNLPVTGPVHLISPNLTLIKNGIIISSDVKYKDVRETPDVWMDDKSFEVVGGNEDLHDTQL